MTVQPQHLLPSDLHQATLVGRVWRQAAGGPCTVVARGDKLFDITDTQPTLSDLLETPNLLGFLAACGGTPIGTTTDWVARSLDANATDRVLAPCDLQPIKACGVTFAVSLLERVIEEQAGGDPSRAAEIRQALAASVGADLSTIKPGSDEARLLKQALVQRGVWSQYLEVGIGPDAEVFTKAPPMSAIGLGQHLGVLPESQWNNPEPEVVLAINSRLEVVGATLGNDVNLRDIEGRSALLLGRAKDNNGACPIGPFIRVFDQHFTLDNVRSAQVSLAIEGPSDGFQLQAVSHMSEISRDPLELVRHAAGPHHQYPDGFMLFLGTMFSPTQDRGGDGKGFTHHTGDLVTITSPQLGGLVNRVMPCDAIPPWQFGIRALYKSLREKTRAPDPLPTAPCTTLAPTVYPSLKGKRVVVTGGASGIGAVLVDAFVQQGAQVVFLDIADKQGQTLQARYPHAERPPRFFRCDLTDPLDIHNTFDAIKTLVGGVDILVNNAANDDRHRVEAVTPAYWDNRIAVNLRHQFLCAQAVVPGMRAQQSGVILNMGSISWHLAMPDLSIYMTAKAGIEGMTRGLARELGPDGIRVNCVVPGAIRTPRQTELWRSPDVDEQLMAAQCLRRDMQPSDVSAMVLFLASDDAAGCSGREYFVDGGMYGS